jgi:hypothetical protein
MMVDTAGHVTCGNQNSILHAACKTQCKQMQHVIGKHWHSVYRVDPIESHFRTLRKVSIPKKTARDLKAQFVGFGFIQNETYSWQLLILGFEIFLHSISY